MVDNQQYYAVIFTSKRTLIEEEAYQKMAAKMLNLARKQDGFIDFETARGEIGISVSYWSDLEAIKAWKKNIDHLLAQKKGKESWYESYKVRICKVERSYVFEKS